MQNNSCYKNLKLLFALRNIAIAGQALAVFITTKFLDIPLQTNPLWIIISSMVLINLFTFLRMKKVSNIKEYELFIQLMADIVALFLLLYFTGGASNPFASLFILQVIIAAVALPAFYTWFTAFIAVIFYTLLMFKNVEVPYFLHHHMGDFFSLHVQGMWISFILLSGIVAWFIVRMNNIIRVQNKLLAESEKMAAIGILAANAAHELGTPLATISLLAEDYAAQMLDKERSDKSQLLQQQIKNCKEILSRITASGGVVRAESGAAIDLKLFMQNIITNWRAKRPDAHINVNSAPLPEVRIIGDIGLEQAIHNLLDNAADSSPEDISVDIQYKSGNLKVTIRDKGEGISMEHMNFIGTAGYTTKQDGMGLGLFLTKSIIIRLNGTLDIRNADDKGVIVVIDLPLAGFVL